MEELERSVKSLLDRSGGKDLKVLIQAKETLEPYFLSLQERMLKKMEKDVNRSSGGWEKLFVHKVYHNNSEGVSESKPNDSMVREGENEEDEIRIKEGLISKAGDCRCFSQHFVNNNDQKEGSHQEETKQTQSDDNNNNIVESSYNDYENYLKEYEDNNDVDDDNRDKCDMIREVKAEKKEINEKVPLLELTKQILFIIDNHNMREEQKISYTTVQLYAETLYYLYLLDDPSLKINFNEVNEVYEKAFQIANKENKGIKVIEDQAEIRHMQSLLHYTESLNHQLDNIQSQVSMIVMAIHYSTQAIRIGKSETYLSDCATFLAKLMQATEFLSIYNYQVVVKDMYDILSTCKTYHYTFLYNYLLFLEKNLSSDILSFVTFINAIKLILSLITRECLKLGERYQNLPTLYQLLLIFSKSLYILAVFQLQHQNHPENNLERYDIELLLVGALLNLILYSIKNQIPDLIFLEDVWSVLKKLTKRSAFSAKYSRYRMIYWKTQVFGVTNKCLYYRDENAAPTQARNIVSLVGYFHEFPHLERSPSDPNTIIMHVSFHDKKMKIRELEEPASERTPLSLLYYEVKRLIVIHRSYYYIFKLLQLLQSSKDDALCSFASLPLFSEIFSSLSPLYSKYNFNLFNLPHQSNNNNINNHNSGINNSSNNNVSGGGNDRFADEIPPPQLIHLLVSSKFKLEEWIDPLQGKEHSSSSSSLKNDKSKRTKARSRSSSSSGSRDGNGVSSSLYRSASSNIIRGDGSGGGGNEEGDDDIKVISHNQLAFNDIIDDYSIRDGFGDEYGDGESENECTFISIPVPKNRTVKKVNILDIKTDQWEDDSLVHECFNCKSPFSLLHRRHHCRVCGRIFDRQCCFVKAKLIDSNKPKLVCVQCLNFHGIKISIPDTNDTEKKSAKNNDPIIK